MQKWSLVIGIILGIVAVALMNVHIASTARAFALLRFKENVSRGTEIRNQSLETVAVPERFAAVLDQVVRAEDQGAMVGKILVQDVEKGDYLQYVHVARPPEMDFDRRIDKSKRALAIPVDDQTAVAGFVEPGSFVDVIATLAEPKADGTAKALQFATKTILRKVKVLAVGDRFTRSRGERDARERRHAGTVTLEVTPLQAEKLIFAQQNAEGPLTLTLVHPDGDAQIEDVVVGWESFDSIQ